MRQEKAELRSQLNELSARFEILGGDALVKARRIAALRGELQSLGVTELLADKA